MNELISKTEVIEDLKKDIAESDNWLVIAIYLAITVRIMSYKNIDAVEVVHGEWIATNKNERGYSDAFACSVCNSIFQYAYQVFKECDYKYCPYCGAKMDERRKE